MRSVFLKSALVLTVVQSWSGVPAAERTDAANGTNPAFKTIGPLAFSPDGVLFAGDTQSAAKGSDAGVLNLDVVALP